MQAIENYKQVHVRSVYWGVRPLLLQQGASLQASREHRLVKDLERFWSIPGVKLTAAREAGLEVATEAWGRLRQGAPIPSVTWDSLPGGDLWNFERFVADAQRRFKIGPGTEGLIAYLVSMYGSRYVEILQWAQQEPQWRDLIVPGEPWIYAQVAYAAQEEMVLTLNDLLWRRTKWAHFRDLSEDAIDRLARTLGQFLGWTEEDREKEIDAYHLELKKHRLA